MVSEEQKYPVIRAVEPEKASDFEAGARLAHKPLGSSGTQIFGGYFAEEYLTTLRGTRGAKIWDEMRRSESQIAMLLAAICNPIKAACWEFEPNKDNPESEKHAKLCDEIFKHQMDWEAFLHEALTFIPFGYSLFEVIHNVVFNHPEFGTFNGVDALAFRSQKTIEQWNVQPQTGKLLSVYQQTYSDVGTNATIPGEFLLLFSLHKEGNNYEGISALRPMYGAYFRKNLYLKLAAIGVEKYAIGTPIGKVPKGEQNSEDIEKFKQILQSYTSHEAAYILRRDGWEIEIQKTDFDAEKIKELILLENTEMINAVVANFLALGTNGGGGAYALGTDLSDFFLSGIQNYANIITGVFNRKLIKSVVDMNFGPQSKYPTLKCTGINDKAGKEFAEIIHILTNSKNITPDMKTEDFLRKQFKMPPADPSTARVEAEQNEDGGKAADKEEQDEPDAAKLSERRLQLDEKYRKQFDAKKEKVKAVMQANIRSMIDALKKEIGIEWKNTPEASRVKIPSKIELPSQGRYKSELKEVLAEVANDALESARKDVPKAKKVKLAESIQLAAPRGGYYAALPSKVRKLVDAQASLIADTQSADIEKVVLFQFSSSAASTDSITTILNDIEEKAAPIIDGATKSGMSIDAAAANAVAHVSNQARLDFFFEPEVLNEIESFTFTNEDPVSDICKALAGTTWGVGDPDLDRYSPPLHHNCKSRLIPNLKGDKNNPEIQRGGTSLSKKALDSITLIEPTYRVSN